ncbi:transcription factor 24-like [Hyperolius riggenbachi]|uniref:transcription factor 24-like n=1 Tax=Hyperolius riggenbachi TaxID=752182 RepID=UPI0035A2C0D0
MLRAQVVLPGWEICHAEEAGRRGDAMDGEEEEMGPRPSRWRRRQRATTGQAVSPVSKSSRLAEGKPSPENNARERNRVRTLRQAFLSLQAALPSVPPDTKLSKLDVLVLATSYIAHLTQTLNQEGSLPDRAHIGRGPGYLHPVKKWPMRARLYAEAIESEISAACAPGKH